MIFQKINQYKKPNKLLLISPNKKGIPDKKSNMPLFLNYSFLAIKHSPKLVF